MSRRWAVYQAAELQRAEQQKARDAILADTIARQERALSKGRDDGHHEVAGEHGQCSGLDASAAAANADRERKVPAVPRGKGRAQRKNVKR